jgi:hypothetical protein
MMISLALAGECQRETPSAKTRCRLGLPEAVWPKIRM